MEKYTHTILGVMCGVTVLLGGQACASSVNDRVAVEAKVSTLGVGADGVVQLHEHFDGRVGVNWFALDYSGSESGVDYDVDLNWLSFNALVDWYPFDNQFRIAGGALINQNEVDLTAETKTSYTIGNTTYTSAQVGTLSGGMDFNTVNPYLGIGWGRPFKKQSNWSVSFDLGAAWQGEPDVTLNTNGTLVNNAAFQADVQREIDDLEGEIDAFQFYPVLRVAISYRF